MFACEISKVFKNTFFTVQLPWLLLESIKSHINCDTYTLFEKVGTTSQDIRMF